MNYCRLFASRTMADGLKKPFVYLVSVFFSIFSVLMMKNIGAANLTAKMTDFLSMAMIFNGLLPVCYISIYLCAHQVFFVEKKHKALTMVLCSPAGLGEVFCGKVLGLFLSAFVVPVLFMLASMALFTPHVLADLASWKALAALGVVCVMALAYTAVVGIALLSARDERIVSVALYGFVAVQFALSKLTKAAAGETMFKGVLFQYTGIMLGFVAVAVGIYFLYFSKIRVVESA